VKNRTKWRVWEFVNKQKYSIEDNVYDSCVWSVILCGAETCAMTWKVEDILKSCDWRMHRSMAGVIWHDKLSREEVAKKCGLKELKGKLRHRKLNGLVMWSKRQQVECWVKGKAGRQKHLKRCWIVKNEEWIGRWHWCWRRSSQMNSNLNRGKYKLWTKTIMWLSRAFGLVTFGLQSVSWLAGSSHGLYVFAAHVGT